MSKKEEIDDNIGNIQPRILEEELQQSYLSYAMSVIVSRALPDVRDGLKPVHRRVLYSMNEMGLRSNAKYRKSSTVVGRVLGDYHPHGDLAAYETIVRMAQEFAMRYPLVDGQGNFGSIDGDGAAAHRYTEAKMTKIAEEMLSDIEKKTVDFMDNYDGTKKEPKVLPAKVPQLLLNGSMGIAVGMATSIPPHNLSEIIDAVVSLVDNPELSIEDLMQYVQGPDFPTGGIIFNPKEIQEAYLTGKGRVVMRAVAEIEEHNKGFRIIVSEIPYQVNKATLIEKIADLVKAKKIVGISDLRDESDKDGIRIVIDLRKDSYPKKVLNQLFKLTQMQSVFHVNLLALVDGIQPQVLNLKSTLEYFINHRKEVVTRRTEFDLNKAQERAHILEGLKIALDNLDTVIKTIKQSNTKEEAHINLVKKFKLSDIQATAILEMRLQALAGLERKKIEDEYKEKKVLIKELKSILSDPKRILAIIKEESLEMKSRYGGERRTKVVRRNVGEFSEEDLVPNEEVVVTITKGGYIKRQPVAVYQSQKRGGKGIIGMTTKEEDIIDRIMVAKNHDDILFFTNKGRVFKQKVYEVPQSSRIAKGAAMVNLIQLAPEEVVTGAITIADYSLGDNFVMITKRGIIKKTAVDKYSNIRASGLIAIKLDEGDELKWIRNSRKGDTVVIITSNGQSIHFKEEDARLLGRSTRGVRAIKLRANDEVVAGDVAEKDKTYRILVISERGLGKRTNLDQYTLQKRGGIGIKTFKITDRTGKVIGARLTDKDMEADLIITSKNGQVIRLSLNNVSLLGRVTQGVTLMRLKNTDKVASFTVLSMEEDLPEESKKEEPNKVQEIKRKVVSQSKKNITKSKKTAVKKTIKPKESFTKKKIAPAKGKKNVSRTIQKAKVSKTKNFSKRQINKGTKVQSKTKSRLSSKSKGSRLSNKLKGKQ